MRTPQLLPAKPAVVLALLSVAGGGAARAVDGALDTTFQGSGKYSYTAIASQSGARSFAFDASGRIVLGFSKLLAGTDRDLVLLTVPDAGAASVCETFAIDLGGTDEDLLFDVVASGPAASAGATLWAVGRADGPSGDPDPQQVFGAVDGSTCDRRTAFGTDGVQRIDYGLGTWAESAIWVPEDGGSLRSVTDIELDEHSVRMEALDADTGGSVGSAGGLFNFSDHFVQQDFEPSGIARMHDGGIVVSGTVEFESGDLDAIVVRFLANGDVDTSFGQGGYRLFSWDVIDQGTDEARAVAILPDGRIVVGGTVSRPAGTLAAVAVLTANGNLDSTFGSVGRYRFDFVNATGRNAVNSIAVQGNGRFVVAGTSGPDTLFSPTDFAFARFLPTGSSPLDTSFSGDGITKVAFDLGGFDADGATRVAIDGSGRIVAVGFASDASGSRPAVVRLTNAYVFANGFESGDKLAWAP